MQLWNTVLASLASVALAASFAGATHAEQPEDAWITTKVKMALLTDEKVGGIDINVDTFDGSVTLHGSASSEEEKARAERRAAEIEGVQGVRNLIAVIPDRAREATEVADDALSESVTAALGNDPQLAESEITVKSVNDGTVVLEGEAETLSAHRRALETAREVDGVSGVASEIESPDELGDAEIWEETDVAEAHNDATRVISDAWITTKAKVALMAEPGLSPLAINVDTRDGVVTMFGIVGSEAVKARAEAEVAQLDGIKAVRNELQVTPDVASEKVEKADDALRTSVRERIGERKALSDASIDVEVSDGVVRLSGTISSQQDRLTALTIARGTEGVESVIDDLKLERPARDGAAS